VLVRRIFDQDGDGTWTRCTRPKSQGIPPMSYGFLADAHTPALRERDKSGWLPLLLAVQQETSLRVAGGRARATKGRWDAERIASHLGSWKESLAKWWVFGRSSCGIRLSRVRRIGG
jgi:hypothetical protein